MVTMAEALDTRAKKEKGDRRFARGLTGFSTLEGIAAAASTMKGKIDYSNAYNNAISAFHGPVQNAVQYATEAAQRAAGKDSALAVASEIAALTFGIMAAYRHGKNRREQQDYYSKKDYVRR